MLSDTSPDVPVDVAFSITSRDANILRRHLDEFKEGDTAAQTLLIDRLMGELYRFRPQDSSLDKVDAKMV